MNKVDQILMQQFSAPREPRSDAYKRGVRAGIAHDIDGTKVLCPFASGSAEFDAFFAGIDEGHLAAYGAQVIAA